MCIRDLECDHCGKKTHISKKTWYFLPNITYLKCTV